MICIVWHGFYTSRCTLREKQHHCYSYLKTRQRCYAYLKTTALLRIPQNDSTATHTSKRQHHTSNCYAYLKLLRIPQTATHTSNYCYADLKIATHTSDAITHTSGATHTSDAAHTSNCYAYLKIATHDTSKLLRIPQNCYAYLKIATHTSNARHTSDDTHTSDATTMRTFKLLRVP